MAAKGGVEERKLKYVKKNCTEAEKVAEFVVVVIVIIVIIIIVIIMTKPILIISGLGRVELQRRYNDVPTTCQHCGNEQRARWGIIGENWSELELMERVATIKDACRNLMANGRGNTTLSLLRSSFL